MQDVDGWYQWNLWYPWIMANWHNTPHGELRLGQHMFNELYLLNTAIANQIRGSIVDPFYNDDKIPAFLERVDELWML